MFGAGCAMRMGELRNAHDYHSARNQGRWHYPFFWGGYTVYERFLVNLNLVSGSMDCRTHVPSTDSDERQSSR